MEADLQRNVRKQGQQGRAIVVLQVKQDIKLLVANARNQFKKTPPPLFSVPRYYLVDPWHVFCKGTVIFFREP